MLSVCRALRFLDHGLILGRGRGRPGHHWRRGARVGHSMPVARTVRRHPTFRADALKLIMPRVHRRRA